MQADSLERRLGAGRGVIGLAVTLVLAACAAQPVDLPLQPAQQNEERRAIEMSPDRPLIVLSFSGGGSRATALAAAVTKRLDRITYPTASGPRRLSQDVAVVSSVSGGSVFAAWLGLYGFDHDRIAAFEQRIGTFDGIGYLTRRYLNPVTWIEMGMTGRTRISVLEDMLAEFLDTRATMAALNQRGKPVIVLNATDMTAGEVFSFTPTTLDDMCLRFDDLPVVTAVAASAAVPVAFSPVLIKNAAWFDCQGARKPPGAWRPILSIDGGAYTNIELFRQARYRASLRNDPLAYRQPHYVRLLDGGLADNLGLTAARRALIDMYGPAYVLRPLSEGGLRRLVVIAVNARSDVPNDLDRSDERTSIVEMVQSVIDVPIDATTANVAAAFRGFLASLAKDRDDAGVSFEILPVEIDFDELPARTPAEREERDRVKAIATTWTLTPDEVKLIDAVAGKLLWRHPCFRRLLGELQASGQPEAAPPANIRCPRW